jgi:hypothetical protein
MSTDKVSNLNWIEEELVGVNLGDRRLDERIVKIASILAEFFQTSPWPPGQGKGSVAMDIQIEGEKTRLYDYYGNTSV